MASKVFLKKKSAFIMSASAVLFFSLLYLFVPKFFAVSYKISSSSVATGIHNIEEIVEEVLEPKTLHLETPESVKAVYMTSCVAGTPSLRENLVDLVEKTELNSLIIDIKDYSGTLSFKPKNPDLLHAWEKSKCGALDMEEFITSLHKKGIYVIGRVTVFQDPHLTARRPDLAVKKASDGSTWKDFKGLSFTDAGSKEVWDYHIKIAAEAYELGFDEINFDYIRFPSDGPMKDIYFTFSNGRKKPDVIEEFFAYLYKNLNDSGIVTSADLFGMTTTNTDDLNIGQVLERAMPYFDYIAPMVYPSHYPPGWNNFSNPNNYPYEIINISMTEAVRRAVSASTPVVTLNGEKIMKEVVEFDEVLGATSTKSVWTGEYKKKSYSPYIMRPWIQDFNYGGTYGPEEVRDQIQAAYDAGLNSWMVWDPANRYSSLRQILKTNDQ